MKRSDAAVRRSPRYHIRNVVSGLLVPGDRPKTLRTFHSTFDATAWITAQYRPQDFEIWEARREGV